MHLHEMESEIFAFPPGTTIAPNYSALSRDPRFPTIARTRKWVIGSSCARDVDLRLPTRLERAKRARSRVRASPSRPGSERSWPSRCCCARPSSASGSGSTKASRSGSRTARWATSRWPCARTARRRCTTCCCTSGWTSRAAARVACAALSLLFALLAIPASFWAGRMIWGTTKAAWFAAVLAAFNPFLAQYAQEARMYSLVALLAIPATTCFVKAYALETEHRRPWIAGFAVSVAVALYTHNWPIFFTLSAAVAFAMVWLLADRPRRRQLLRDGAARLRRPGRALPPVGADDALPGGPHRRALGRPARPELAVRRPRHPARPDAADRAADLRRRRPRRALAPGGRAPERARPRRACS